MAEIIIVHRIHGHSTHDLAIYLAERHLKIKKCILKDPTIFKKKFYYPGEPDIYFDVIEGGKRYTYIVEMESNPTKANTEKKNNQFKGSNAGITDMILIDLSKCEHPENWIELDTYIKKWLPI